MFVVCSILSATGNMPHLNSNKSNGQIKEPIAVFTVSNPATKKQPASKRVKTKVQVYDEDAEFEARSVCMCGVHVQVNLLSFQQQSTYF